MTEPLDLLAIMAHPDDAELLCGGSLSKATAQGDRVGILDLTQGEAASVGVREDTCGGGGTLRRSDGAGGS